MKLYLIRHGDAISEWEDPERPLSARGREEVQETAQHLQGKDLKVSLIFHSPKQRAQQTAEIIKSRINPQAQMISQDYLSPNGHVESLIQDISGVQGDLLVVGHLPFLPRLIETIIPQEGKKAGAILKTGSAIALEQNGSSTWHMLWSFTPTA